MIQDRHKHKKPKTRAESDTAKQRRKRMHTNTFRNWHEQWEPKTGLLKNESTHADSAEDRRSLRHARTLREGQAISETVRRTHYITVKR